MTTSTQTQLRRGTKTQVNATTPALGEAVVNTTDKRIHVGDGSLAGGMPHANAQDVQNHTFTYPAVGGTANAITLTNTFPKAALTDGQGGKFKAGATNTGAVTINEDGRGVVAVKRLSGGSLVALVAGDIVSGGVYEYAFDGTQYQIGGADLPSTGVTAGSYTNASITVDAKGRVTSASNGTSGTPTPGGVGSVLLANCSATPLSMGSRTSASSLTVQSAKSGTPPFGNSGDTISGTWQALQSVSTGNSIGLFQRTA